MAVEYRVERSLQVTTSPSVPLSIQLNPTPYLPRKVIPLSSSALVSREHPQQASLKRVNLIA